jgi:RNA polymerase primary sigma factor
MYLREINATPLLDADEEQELAARIANGDPSARDHMIRANLRLVVNIARGYLGKGLSLEDLIEEGNLGLMRAVQSFDGTRETRFSTYASYWIKYFIRRAVMNQGAPIRLPVYMVKLLNIWRRASHDLNEELGRPASTSEVAQFLKLSPKKTRLVLEAQRVRALKHTNGDPDESDNGSLLASHPDQSAAMAEQQSENDDRLQLIFEWLEIMDARKATILRLHLGLYEGPPLIFREIGEKLGLSRESTRQIYIKALEELVRSLHYADE